ncbi:thrombin inhibitor hemalin-like [Dermacentor variabilis]|uniref:thrombin inhibitor hemalin-like n=1 Tax=Dermacentor variabilis TaxID=34621 RepID=UPI003F5B57FA
MKLYIFLALIGTAIAARNFDKECRQAPDRGFCRAQQLMWWFNVESGRCEQFYYGGCGGNENKYETKEQCQENCSAEKPARNFDKECRQAPDRGFCRAQQLMWWFNVESGRCEQFYYGGCGGNENKYETKEQCQENCSAEKPILRPYPRDELLSGRTGDIVSASIASVCQMPPQAGPCQAAITRFYYDANAKTCRPFVYGGCHGNGNNFESHRDCMRFCASPMPMRPEPRLA